MLGGRRPTVKACERPGGRQLGGSWVWRGSCCVQDHREDSGHGHRHQPGLTQGRIRTQNPPGPSESRGSRGQGPAVKADCQGARGPSGGRRLRRRPLVLDLKPGLGGGSGRDLPARPSPAAPSPNCNKARRAASGWARGHGQVTIWEGPSPLMWGSS